MRKQYNNIQEAVDATVNTHAEIKKMKNVGFHMWSCEVEYSEIGSDDTCDMFNISSPEEIRYAKLGWLEAEAKLLNVLTN